MIEFLPSSFEDVNHDCQELFSIVTRVMRGIGKWQVGNSSVPIQFARKRGPCVVYQTTCQSFAHPIFHERLSQQCSATQIQSPSILPSPFNPPPLSNLMCVHVSTHARNRRARLRRRGRRSQAVYYLSIHLPESYLRLPTWIDLAGRLLLRPPSTLTAINVQVNSEKSSR